MNPLEPLAFAIECLRRAARELLRPGTWAPWAALWGIEAAVTLALAYGAHPALSWAVVPLLRLLHAGDALVYPALFARLPTLVARVADPLRLVTLPIAAGWATRVYADRFDRRPGGAGYALAVALRRAAALIVVALPVAIAGAALQAGAGALIAQRVSSFTRGLAPQAAVALTVVARALALYGPALVMLGGLGAWRAVAALPRTWRSGFTAAALAALAEALIAWPLVALARQSPVVAARGVPELVIGITLLHRAAGAAGAALATATATLAWQARVGPDLEGGT